MSKAESRRQLRILALVVMQVRVGGGLDPEVEDSGHKDAVECLDCGHVWTQSKVHQVRFVDK